MTQTGSESAATRIELREWERHDPTAQSPLRGVFLPTDTASRRAIAVLSQRGMLHLTEMRHGLAVESTSFVGRVRVGGLTVTIQPKIDALPLLCLLHYTYGLRDLTLVGASAGFAVSGETPFSEILTYQLAAEVRALLRRGLHRAYRRREEPLHRPRGRIDLTALVKDSIDGRHAARATLPCIHYERDLADALHQSLHAGLRWAARLTADPTIRRALRGLVIQLESAGVAPPDPGEALSHLLHRARREQTRLTAPYHAALMLIELLHAGDTGPTLEEGRSPGDLALPGFLFDMNRFFQALIGRFLTENLPALYTIRSERGLRDMIAYHPDHNPRRRTAPTPRPDFALYRNRAPVALLDAKYRDLWERPLPREMLYQLALYAAFGAPRDHDASPHAPTATILYPILAAAAQEQHVEIRHPATGAGGGGATVILRPVDMRRLAELVSGGKESAVARQQMATMLAAGGSSA